jgi:hypothetical protein
VRARGYLLSRRPAALFKKDDAMDLTRLNDDELKLLERILKKAAGEIVGDVVPQFRVVRDFVDTAEPTADANYVER